MCRSDSVTFWHQLKQQDSRWLLAIIKVANEPDEWAEQQRHTLRHEDDAVSKVVARAAQQKRRNGLKGTKDDYHTAINYLKKYRSHMDFAERKRRGDPIGSGITEAGCKVIFNQRLKQSGMRWHRQTGQYIVDLRTANRSGIWNRIWDRLVMPQSELPPITQTKSIGLMLKPKGNTCYLPDCTLEQSLRNGQSKTSSSAPSPYCERNAAMCFVFHRPEAMSLATSMGARGVIIFMAERYA